MSEYNANKHLAQPLQLIDYKALNHSSLMNERKALRLPSASSVIHNLKAEGIVSDPKTWSLLEVVK